MLAQKGYQDTIYLKNGTSINGKIIKRADWIVEIQTVDNKLFVFDMNKIKIIIKEPSIAQKDTLQKSKIYRTWIRLDKKKQRADVLYQIKDSSIIVAKYLHKRDFLSGKYQTTEIEYKNIGIIEIGRKNSVIKGALSGLIIGSLAGAIIGYSSGSDHPLPGSFDIFCWSATDKAKLLGVLFSLPGLIIGTLIGSLRIRIPIDISIDNFNKNKELLKKYSYKR
jgi:hypothetical protein